MSRSSGGDGSSSSSSNGGNSWSTNDKMNQLLTQRPTDSSISDIPEYDASKNFKLGQGAPTSVDPQDAFTVTSQSD